MITPRPSPAPRGERGLTLVEVLVSLGVLAIVSLSVMSMLSTSLHLDSLAEERSGATALATERLGQIASMKFQNDTTYTSYKLPEETAVTGPPKRLVSAYGKIPGYPNFRREVVLDYDKPLSGMLRVKATVWWHHAGQTAERNHTMITFLHPGLEK